MEDLGRNRIICEDVHREYQAGSTVLVLSDRLEHCKCLQAMLAHMDVDAVLLNGRLSKGARASVMTGIVSGNNRVIIATSSLAGEGLDIPHLGVLMLASPVKFSGRVLRPAPGKARPRVYDYKDRELEWQSRARQRVHERLMA